MQSGGSSVARTGQTGVESAKSRNGLAFRSTSWRLCSVLQRVSREFYMLSTECSAGAYQLICVRVATTRAGVSQCSRARSRLDNSAATSSMPDSYMW